MKKIAAIIIVLIIIVVGAVLIATKGSDNNKNNTTSDMAGMNMNQSTNSGNAPSNQNANPVDTNTVTIANFAFSPADISVKAGTKVTWTNNDSTAHTVDETDGQSGPASGMVNPGASYSFTFDKPGTYHYHCSIHPEMTGTITVTQ